MMYYSYIELPNEMGFIPCSAQYYDIFHKMLVIRPYGINTNELSPSNFREWKELHNKLLELAANDHIGKPILYT